MFDRQGLGYKVRLGARVRMLLRGRPPRAFDVQGGTGGGLRRLRRESHPVVFVVATAVSLTACSFSREVKVTPWFKETVTQPRRYGIFHIGPDSNVVYSARVGKGWWNTWINLGENPFGSAARVLGDGQAVVFTTKLAPSGDRSIGPGGIAAGFEFELIFEGEARAHPVARDFPCSPQGLYAFPPNGSRIDCAVCLEERIVATFPTPRAGGGFELGTTKGCVKAELRRTGLMGSPVSTDVVALPDDERPCMLFLPPLYDGDGAPYFSGRCTGDSAVCLLVAVGAKTTFAPKGPGDGCGHAFWARRAPLAALSPATGSLFQRPP